MNKTGAKVSMIIGLLLTVACIGLFGYWLMTSKTTEGHFLGHLDPNDRSKSQNELLGYVAIYGSIVAFLPVGFGLAIDLKGKTKAEKKIEGKRFTLISIGYLMSIIALFVLTYLVGKVNTVRTGYKNNIEDLPSDTWVWIGSGVFAMGLMIGLIGGIKLLMQKPIVPLITQNSTPTIKDEF